MSIDDKFNLKRFLIICSFYGLVGFSGIVLIPCLAIIAPVFIFCGIITPILVGIKMLAHIFGIVIPFFDHIGIFLHESFVFSPVVEFAFSLLIGGLLCLTGWGAWRLLVLYCNKVGKTARSLSIRRN